VDLLSFKNMKILKLFFLCSFIFAPLHAEETGQIEDNNKNQTYESLEANERVKLDSDRTLPRDI
tara:strand:+ start:2500 stop:2691 length:192 start_codon:yes stop_codon:yes gene_type:complete